MNVYLHPDSERVKFLPRGKQHARDFKALQVKLKVIYKKTSPSVSSGHGVQNTENIKAANERGVL